MSRVLTGEGILEEARTVVGDTMISKLTDPQVWELFRDTFTKTGAFGEEELSKIALNLAQLTIECLEEDGIYHLEQLNSDRKPDSAMSHPLVAKVYRLLCSKRILAASCDPC